jgi:hypothetical protein
MNPYVQKFLETTDYKFYIAPSIRIRIIDDLSLDIEIAKVINDNLSMLPENIYMHFSIIYTSSGTFMRCYLIEKTDEFISTYETSKMIWEK